MPLYKSPKSGKLIEVESDFDTETGTDRAREEAISKGWRPVHQVVSKSGKSINVDDDGLDEALSKGWMIPQVRDAKRAKVGIGAGESVARGVAQGGTFGFADEAQAALRAPFSERTYSELRDEYRGGDDAAEDENPVAFYGGAIGTGLASLGAGAAGAAKTGATVASAAGRAAAAGAAEGALGGFGAGRGSAASQATSTAIGAAGGGLLGGAGGAIGAKLAGKAGGEISGIPGSKVVGDAASKATFYGKSAVEGAYQGMKESPSMGLVDVVAKPVEAARGAYKAVRSARDADVELGSLAKSVGSGKDLTDGVELSDDLGLDLLSPGPSKAKDFVATKAATLGGQTDVDQYRRIMEMGPDRRIAARDFNPKAIAEELAPQIEELGEAFVKARGQGFGASQAEAMAGLDQAVTERVIPRLYEVMDKSTQSRRIQGRTRATLEDVNELLTRGKSAEFEVAPGDWRKLPPAEKFKRMQYARQMLDSEIDWNRDNKIPVGESLLRGMRDELDAALKAAPGKAEGDAFYGRGADLEKEFFDVTEFRQPSGKYQTDEFTLARLFGNNDKAGRFAKTLDALDEYAQDPKFNPETGNRVRALVQRLRDVRSLADDARDLQSFRYKPGPTSPEMQRQSYLMNRANLPSDTVGAPENFVASVDQFIKEFAVKGYGKPFAELPDAQKSKLLKLYIWTKNNPRASQREMQEAAAKLLK